MRAVIVDKRINLFDCFTEKEIIKSRFDGVWNAKCKCWSISLTPSNIVQLRALFGLEIDMNEQMQKMVAVDNIVDGLKDGRIEPDYSYNDYFKVDLMKHQIVGATIADMLFDAGYTGCLLSMEMGTGKTLTAMAIIDKLIEKNKCSKVLIVCPKIAMNVWRDEYKKFELGSYKTRVIGGTAKKRIEAMNDLVEEPDKRLNIAVINYEYAYAFQDVLKKWKPDIIVCDESHRIKGVTTNQTKAITSIGQSVKYKLCLTGTPLTRDILDFFSQFKFLDSSIFGLNYYSYKTKYAVTGMFGEYLRPNKAYFDEFRVKVNKISYRVTKEQCLQLPPFTDIVIPVEIGCRKMYNELEKEYITWLNENEFISVENALTKTLKLRQLTSGFYYNVDEQGNRNAVFVDDSKINACMDLLEDLISSGNKVIVFAEFQAEIEKIKELCDKEGIISETYYGKTSDKKKELAVDRFQNGDCQVFIGQIESAGISITLTSASHMIFVSTGYKYGVYDQARARIHRKGQVNKCTYYHLIATKTIDESIMRSLKNKETLAKSIIDDYRKGV